MRPSFRRPGRWIIPGAALIFAVLGVTILSVFNTSAFPIDDAFISFRYARNLIDGFGLVFNQGERVEAYSNFLWLLLVSALGYSGLSETLAARFLGLAALTGLCLLLFIHLRRATRSLFVPVAVTVAFMLLPGTIFHTLSGMETVLSAVLLLAVGAILESDIEARKKASLAGLCLAAFSLNRPEGLLVFACIMAGAAAMRLFKAKEAVHPAWLLAAYACVLLPFVVWRFSYYGTLLPNSVLAKGGFPHPAVLKAGVKYLGMFLFWHAPVALLAVFSFFSTFSTRRARWVTFRIPVSAALVTMALVGGGGDGYPYFRYLYPLFACLTVWSVEGGLSIWHGTVRNRGGAVGAVFLTLLVGIPLVLLIGQQLRAPLIASDLSPLRRLPAFFGETPQSADPALLREKGLGHYQAADWLREHASAGDLLATYEIGILPYFSRLPVLDLFGLADRHIAENRGLPGQRADLPYLWSRKPAYIMLRVVSDCLCSDYPLFFDRRLTDDYDLVGVFPYWTTDILLFKRRGEPSEDVVYELTSASEKRIQGPIRVLEHIQLLGEGEREKLIAGIRQAGDPDKMRKWIRTWRSGFVLAAAERPERASVTVELPVPEKASLISGISVTANQQPWPTGDDGRARVEIVVTDDLRTDTLFEREFDGKTVTAGWEDFQLNLARFAGRRVKLSFKIENQGIPVNVGFGDPRIVSRGGAD